ncbi:N-acetylmuramoyl-L-alanine amidase [Sporosarcina sp. BP05]|uniref:N-acetylmuramoyl-L-alanine amidase family protein n=1 Tax=Sporosarcina sp. BP05 TaxID=2758726 RepID=UPI0021069AE5|nr:N-acetylmuramoyl-L-alanine amidase [Sporosarcina sp. BP05]
MTTLLIDAGHGPETAGKRSPDGLLREFSFNSAVADLVKQFLIEEGFTVIFAHKAQEDVPLTTRIKLANSLTVDAFVSIHANAFGNDWNSANGIETFVYPTASKASIALASLVQSALITACNRTDRGVKKANYAVLRETRIPAILIECGFMTNREEAALLMRKAYRLQCARAIAHALSTWIYRGKK